MASPNLNFTYSKCRLRRVKKIQFGIFPPEVIVSLPFINRVPSMY